MASNWPSTSLESIAEVIDSRHKTPKYSELGWPMVRVVDVKGGALNLLDTKKVSDEVYDDFSKGRDPELGDLVISRVGSYGNISYVSTTDKFCLGQNTALIVPKIQSRFLYYQLISPQVKWQIEQQVVGAVQKTISLKSIKQLSIAQPPLHVQKLIAESLGTLDDKIDLNRQINETLEQMAQALFKSWFVDFDPVIDNALDAGNPIPEALAAKGEQRRQLRATAEKGEAEVPALPDDIRSLFPSEFEFTEEMGWIPKGWCATDLNGLSETITDGAHQSPPSVDAGVGLPMASSKDLTPNGIDTGSCRYISKEDFNLLVRNGCAPKIGDVLIAKDGARCAETSCVHDAELDIVLLSSIAIIRPKYSQLAAYIHLLLSRKEAVTDLRENYVSGSAIPRIVLRDFKRFPAILPSKIIVECWDIQMRAMYEKRASNVQSNNQLSKLRDMLLPKLISGELEIPEAEKLAAEALN